MDLNLIDYNISKRLERIPFSALIAAAIKKADSDNLEILKKGFPNIHEQLFVRYHAGGGILPIEKDMTGEAHGNAQLVADTYINDI